MTAYEMAKKYYPRLWSIERLKVLCEKDIITKEQFKEITNQDY